ncbi:unnamed protein product [Euphydryas editha]|uniref:Uncharacterized protein n=1 Tax=Euphydryas editha TaxID=104508 RepID=A0AAU9TXK6_EUPED|nr:unnamed protein product [Euphydryas editha]
MSWDQDHKPTEKLEINEAVGKLLLSFNYDTILPQPTKNIIKMSSWSKLIYYYISHISTLYEKHMTCYFLPHLPTACFNSNHYG